MAVQTKSIKALKCLLRYGADVNVQNHVSLQLIIPDLFFFYLLDLSLQSENIHGEKKLSRKFLEIVITGYSR